MTWVTNVATFKDFLSLVIVHAPDDFPQEDFLEDDEQLDLNKAFAELFQGLEILTRQKHDSQASMGELRQMLDDALAAYQAGRDVQGAHILQDFEERAFL